MGVLRFMILNALPNQVRKMGHERTTEINSLLVEIGTDCVELFCFVLLSYTRWYCLAYFLSATPHLRHR